MTAGCGPLDWACFEHTPEVFYFFPFISMVQQPYEEGQRPAPPLDATPPAKSVPEIKLRDGLLSVTVFSRSVDKKEKQYFVVPERSFRNDASEWITTHLLHPEDLLPMSLLLQRAYSDLRQANADAKKKSA